MLSSAPSDEIAEAWENATQLAKVALVIGIASIAILHLLFGRVLAPLRSLATGLLDLGRSDYDVRLRLPQARELAVIAESFNGLAADLTSMKAENRRLSQRLITAQDDERRQTALDLHDEVGPYLFGLKDTIRRDLHDTPDLHQSFKFLERCRQPQLQRHAEYQGERLLPRLPPKACRRQ